MIRISASSTTTPTLPSKEYWRRSFTIVVSASSPSVNAANVGNAKFS